MLRRISKAPIALAHYAVGSVYLLAHLMSYELIVKQLQPASS